MYNTQTKMTEFRDKALTSSSNDQKSILSTKVRTFKDFATSSDVIHLLRDTLDVEFKHLF